MLPRAAPTWLPRARRRCRLSPWSWRCSSIARIALRWLASAMEWPVARRALGATAALLLVIFGAQQLFAQPAAVVSFADPVTPAYAASGPLRSRDARPGRSRARLGPTPDSEQQPRASRGRGRVAGLRRVVRRRHVRDAGDRRRTRRESRRSSRGGDGDGSRGRDRLRRFTDVRRIVVARASEPHLGRRGARPVRLHVADGVEPRDDDHQLRAAWISNRRADAGHAAGLARGRLLSLRPDLRPRSAGLSRAGVRMVEHSGSVRAREDRRARAQSPDAQAAVRRLSDEHDACAVRTGRAVSA